MTERDIEEKLNDLTKHQDNMAMRIVLLEAKVKDLEYVQDVLGDLYPSKTEDKE